MKLKTVKIIVESFESTNERWLKAIKGKTKTRSTEEIITVESWEILGRLLSPSRLQILSEIPYSKPKSIAELARQLKRDFKNVYKDVQFLADMGLIDLKEEGPRHTLRPVAKYKEIELPLLRKLEARTKTQPRAPRKQLAEDQTLDLNNSRQLR